MHGVTRRSVLTGVGGATGVALAGCLEDDPAPVESDTGPTSAVQYQGPACDCCDVYYQLLEDVVDDVDQVVDDDLQERKTELGIRPELRSCHTVDYGAYLVEGHMPFRVVEELFQDAPDIDGIALPGMPAGSPGMGGQKEGEWTIYVIETGHDPERDPEVYTTY